MLETFSIILAAVGTAMIAAPWAFVRRQRSDCEPDNKPANKTNRSVGGKKEAKEGGRHG